MIAITNKQPTWTRNRMWSLQGASIEVSVTAFERILGWVPEPGSLHEAELDLTVLKSHGSGGDADG